ncbi:MAG: aminopeptidase N [Geminicoccaceae bacterium]
MGEQSAPQAVYLSDYRRPDYRVDTIDLIFQLDPEATRVSARIHFVRLTALPVAVLLLDGEDLHLDAIAIDGEPLANDAYRLTGEGLELIRPPERFTLETTVTVNPSANTKLMGLYMSNGVYCTQCEAQGFRRITFFLDRPDVLARYRVRLEGDQATLPKLLSNGNRVEAGSLEGGRHYAVWEDPHPKPAYLFALVAGDLALLADSYVTMSGREVALEIYSEHAFIDQCHHAMASLKRAMRWDEQRFGLEYDLDIYMIVAVSDFNMGAMENKGLNVFNTSATLARWDTSTDSDFVNVERVIAHEYFHNWTGNRVTCRDWFQLTLKEGLTVFRDQEFTADHHSRAVKRIADVTLLREGQFPEDGGPLAHPIRPESYVEINNFYTRTVYEKGAEVIRMIHTLIGGDAFRAGMDLYFQRHDGQAVTCEDFVDAMATASGRDLTAFFRWYGQAGTPRVTAHGSYDPNDQSYTLTLEQETPPTPGQAEKHPLVIPVVLGLLSRSGEEIPLRLDGENAATGTERTVQLSEASQRFVFRDVPEPPVPSLLRRFSAPIRLETDHGNEDLAHLLSHDRDGFARWQAGQDLATRILLQAMTTDAEPEALAGAGLWAEAFERVLADEQIDASFKAQLLKLPSANYLAQQIEPIPVDAISRVRRQVAGWLGRINKRRFQRLYESTEQLPLTFDADVIGRRQLRNVALGYLYRGGVDQAVQLVIDQFDRADTMTDGLSALALLAERDDQHATDRLEAFFERWQHEPLVVNKWFAAQAMAERHDSVERVRDLLCHPAYKPTNPNRVRSVLGVFAAANPTGFHRKDGEGYALIADAIIALDRNNPHLSARLATAFGRWRRYDDQRQALMRGELERVAATEPLSRDLYEIVDKTLSG